MTQPTATERDLIARLERHEDTESICRLKAAYCAACDDDHNGETVVSLFAPNGTWRTTLGTECTDLDEIRAYFRSIQDSGRMRYSSHMVTNPTVDLAAGTAVGTWSFAMMYADHDGRRFRILGFYRDEFVKLEGTWRFRSIASTVQEYVELEVTEDLLQMRSVD